MDGWNTTFLLGRPIFSGYVSFREGIHLQLVHFPIDFRWFPLPTGVLLTGSSKSHPHKKTSDRSTSWNPHFRKGQQGFSPCQHHASYLYIQYINQVPPVLQTFLLGNGKKNRQKRLQKLLHIQWINLPTKLLLMLRNPAPPGMYKKTS